MSGPPVDACATMLFMEGESYALGVGVPQDWAKAMHFYELAAKRGHTGAQSCALLPAGGRAG
jgi:TPR repeat protein